MNCCTLTEVRVGRGNIGQAATIGIHLCWCAADGYIAALRRRTLAFESQLGEGLADLLLAQRIGEVATDNLQGHGGRHQFTGITLCRLAEVQIDEFQFRMHRLKLAVMLRQALYLRLVEPVAETLLVERIGLCIDGVVVERAATS